MPIPVPIPSGALVITDAESTRAEALVAAIAQVIRSGTDGATSNTPGSTAPSGPNQAPVPVVLDTPESQLYQRQVAIALVKAFSAAEPGSPTSATISTFDASCSSSDAVGDLVRVTAANKVVSRVDITDILTMPAVGLIIQKPSSTTAVVQCAGLIQGIFTGLTAGDVYYVGSNGRPTNSIPTPGVGASVFLQPIGVAIDADVLLLTPQFTLNELPG